eukprot:TRINITY_DN13107_c1_g5_i1.p2 TRINITY_DN13107_c1_g5~~TRINITY_DN13107_c1_g5_i1.p2  ORF type:complete len:100 (-),score=22.37 TRINITY_DN13107_c1_g5_i1:52-351(-)
MPASGDMKASDALTQALAKSETMKRLESPPDDKPPGHEGLKQWGPWWSEKEPRDISTEAGSEAEATQEQESRPIVTAEDGWHNIFSFDITCCTTRDRTQ